LQIGRLQDALQELRESIKVSLQHAETQRQQYEAEAEATAEADKAVYQVSSVDLRASFNGKPQPYICLCMQRALQHMCCALRSSHTLCSISCLLKRCFSSTHACLSAKNATLQFTVFSACRVLCLFTLSGHSQVAPCS
jgi:hypothetical protein